MPMHDWTRATTDVYPDFHACWLVEIRHTLNRGLLPPGYYARSEQTTRTMGPDVLTLQTRSPPPTGGPAVGNPGAARLAVRTTPPKVQVSDSSGPLLPASRRRVAIRHSSGDELIALIELVSPRNKAGQQPFRTFVRKVVRAVEAGIHMLVIDPFPPGRRDPHGLHAAIWPDLGGNPFTPPADKPLTLASYEAGVPGGTPNRCYVEPIAVGDVLPDMPLFLDLGEYVNVPLEATYAATWAEMLPQDRAALDPP